MRDESKIVDGVTETEIVATPLRDLFVSAYSDEGLPDNVRVERQVTLTGAQFAALHGADKPTAMDRKPGDRPIKYTGRSALDVFGAPEHAAASKVQEQARAALEDQGKSALDVFSPSPSERVADAVERLKTIEQEKTDA